MRRYAVILALPLLIGLFVACFSSSTTSSVEGTLKIPNGLGFGGSDDGIVVEFVQVTNDSRCAAEVQCVRAGEAFVTLGTVVDGGERQLATVEIAPRGTATLTVDRFTITLLQLRPDPPPVGGVSQRQYELRLRIEET